MKRPLSPQLAVIIANISAMFPPGKPETTNNKGQNFLQIQHFLLMLEPRLPLIGCVVCSLESKCQDTVHVCVCLLIIFFAGLKKRKSSIRGLPAERRHAWNVYQHQSVPPITPHTVESLRNPLSGFWWSQLVQVWDVTEGRHRNKEAQLTSFSLSHSAVSPLPPASLSCLKWHRWLL